MKKIQLIDLLIHRLSGGDCPQELKGKYHPEIIAKHISICLNYLIKEISYKEAERNEDWASLDSYAKAFENVPVLFSEARNEKYIDLPCTVISLPANRGIRLVSPMHDQKFSFFYRNNNSVNLFGNLDVDNVSSRPRFYVEGNKLFFSKHLSDDIVLLLLKLISDFDSLDEDDEVQVPSGYGKLIFDLVMQSMMGMPLEKVSNDNNANIP